jgi:hypothetical protein
MKKSRMTRRIEYYGNSFLKKEELPEEWKLIVVSVYKKGDKTDFSNCRGISILPTTYKTVSNIPL